jgi:hypothetical protein
VDARKQNKTTEMKECTVWSSKGVSDSAKTFIEGTVFTLEVLITQTFKWGRVPHTEGICRTQMQPVTNSHFF